MVDRRRHGWTRRPAEHRDLGLARSHALVGRAPTPRTIRRPRQARHQWIDWHCNAELRPMDEDHPLERAVTLVCFAHRGPGAAVRRRPPVLATPLPSSARHGDAVRLAEPVFAEGYGGPRIHLVTARR